MKRTWMGLGLLILLLALGLGVHLLLGRDFSRMEDQLTEAAGAEFSQAQRIAEKTGAHFRANMELAAIFSPQAPLEQMDQLFTQLERYAGAGRELEYRLLCLQLAGLSRQIEEMLGAMWWSLL